MDRPPEDEMTTGYRQALESLPGEMMPPSSLEDRVVEKLKRSNLIGPPKATVRRPLVKIAFASAASVLLFIAGVMAGAWWASQRPSEATVPEFLLILRMSEQELQALSSEERSQRVKEYGVWAGELDQAGLLLGGEKLTEEARHLQKVGGRITVSRDRLEQAQTPIAGYFLIRANDYDHAMSVAGGCPHLKYGGSIEVRQIERL